MKSIHWKAILLIALVSVGWNSYGQTDDSNTYPPPPPKTDDQVKFKLSGYANMDYMVPESGTGGFVQAVFAPIFTWRPSDKLFFQSEVEFASEGESYDGAFELEFATLNYLICDHITLYAGKFLGPVGTFQARFHPSWINKSVNKPIGFGSKINGLKRLGAGSEAGVGLKGGSQLGSAKLNYDIYIANGGILDPSAGELEMESLSDNNKNKAVGGRLGVLPISNSSLEVGFSFYNAKVGDMESEYEDTKVNLYAVDLNYVKSTSAGVFDIKGEFQKRVVDEGTVYYAGPSDSLGFTFNNNPSVLYGQLAYRLPSVSNAIWLSHFEFVGRLAKMMVDEGPGSDYVPPTEGPVETASTFGSNLTDITLGLNYWVNFNTVLKIGYDVVTYDDAMIDALPNNSLTVQAAMGF